MRRWRAENPDKAAAAYQRELERNRQKRYGISPAQFEEMFEAQGRCCAICKSPDSGVRDWHLDHDHDWLFYRGILCTSCNTGLGLFKDSVCNLKAAIEYLTYPKAVIKAALHDSPA